MRAKSSIHWDPDADEAGSGWLSYLVFPGGSAGMDAVIQALGRPLVRRVRGIEHECWFFERASDERGPHVRVRIRPRAGQEEPVRRRYERVIAEALADVRKHPPIRHQPLLPTARESGVAAHFASYRAAYGRSSERFGGEVGPDRAELAFHVSSQMAVGVLPLLAPARSRAGFALRAMAETIDVAVAPEDRRAFWSRYVRYWIGGETPDGQRTRTKLARQAARMSDDLWHVGDALRANPGIHDLIRGYLGSVAGALEAEAATEFGAADLNKVAFDHVHLTNNRLGVAPVEEALLALILLQRLGEPVPVPVPGPIPQPVVETPPRPSSRNRHSRTRAEADTDQTLSDGPEVAVEITDVSKSYGTLEALRGVSLSVRRGEVFGLVGPNGAGKTSLVECIVGLREPTSGTIRVLGGDPRQNRSALLARIGIQPQKAELFTHLTAGEILDLWCAMFPTSPGVEAILRRVSLEDKAGSRVGRLSGGQRQRLVLGLALASDPELLFLDEPGAALDVEARDELHETIKGLRSDGRTVVVATHDMEEAETLCDRLAILVAGRVEDCDTPDRLVSAWLPEQTVTFRVASRPPREVLRRLAGATNVEVSIDGKEWEVQIKTLRPDELLVDIANVDAVVPVGGVRVHRGRLVDVVREAMRAQA